MPDKKRKKIDLFTMNMKYREHYSLKHEYYETSGVSCERKKIFPFKNRQKAKNDDGNVFIIIFEMFIRNPLEENSDK